MSQYMMHLTTRMQKLTQTLGCGAVFGYCQTVSILIHHFGKKQSRGARHVGNGNQCPGIHISRFYFCFRNRIVHRGGDYCAVLVYYTPLLGRFTPRSTTLTQFRLNNRFKQRNTVYTIEISVTYGLVYH